MVITHAHLDTILPSLEVVFSIRTVLIAAKMTSIIKSSDDFRNSFRLTNDPFVSVDLYAHRCSAINDRI